MFPLCTVSFYMHFKFLNFTALILCGVPLASNNTVSQYQPKRNELSSTRHTSSISVAEVGKPPDIAQAHSIAHAGEDKLNLVAPVPSPGVFILLH